MPLRDISAVKITASESGRTGLDERYTGLRLQAGAATFHATKAALVRAETGAKDSLIGVEMQGFKLVCTSVFVRNLLCTSLKRTQAL